MNFFLNHNSVLCTSSIIILAMEQQQYKFLTWAMQYFPSIQDSQSIESEPQY